jgi:hypothetical protein
MPLTGHSCFTGLYVTLDKAQPLKNLLFLLLAFVAMQSCTTKQSKPHEKSEIVMAMREYDNLIKKLDADAIALLYDEEGDLGKVAHGRDSIRSFLKTFKDVQVLEQLSTSDVVEVMGDSAKQEGSYVQVDVIGNKDTVTVRGTYKALWKWDGDAWKIKRMETTPL